MLLSLHILHHFNVIEKQTLFMFSILPFDYYSVAPLTDESHLNVRRDVQQHGQHIVQVTVLQIRIGRHSDVILGGILDELVRRTGDIFEDGFMLRCEYLDTMDPMAQRMSIWINHHGADYDTTYLETSGRNT